VAWFNYYQNGCCAGGFGIATSSDGIIFTLVHANVTGKYKDVDCNGLFVDDNGTGYIIYSAIDADHKVSIEKLTPDFLGLTGDNFGLFPDRYVEGPILFKRNNLYYVSYGSCCCFCRGGSGAIFFVSESITGPWKRLGNDKNCLNDALVCGAFGDRQGSMLIIPAQGIGLSVFPTNQGMVYLWHGERWLSAPYNNPTCPDECRPETGICAEPDRYVKGHGYSYWIPLEFEDSGDVKQFSPFVTSFKLDLMEE